MKQKHSWARCLTHPHLSEETSHGTDRILALFEALIIYPE